jgi:diguanylate cyclase (GGDEF)-like protein
MIKQLKVNIGQIVSRAKLVGGRVILLLNQQSQSVYRYLRNKTLFSRRKQTSLVRRFQVLLLGWGLVIYALSVLGFWWASNNVIEEAYIDLGLDFSLYQQRLTDNIMLGSALISLTFLFAVIIGRILTQKALRPLSDLREPLDRLAKGDTDVWVDKCDDEELAAISNAINVTILAIKGRDEKLRRLADYDALTGLMNKRKFNSVLEREKKRVAKEKDSSALLFIDLDQFKYVNDTLGHAAGDRLLVQVADLLTARMRDGDIVSRLGGDEFTVLARSVDEQGAINIAQSIVKEMQNFIFMEEGKKFNIYCSVGIALIENDKFTAEEVFSHVDMACYSAKSEGRNRYHLYQEGEVDDNKMDMGWSHRIKQAILNDSFMLHFQPVVTVADSDHARYEVLLRMMDKELGLVMPGVFIPAAERLGLATEIDYWVIRSSMKMLQEQNKKNNHIQLFVNLSGQLFSDPEFVNRIINTLDDFDIDASQIIFELTERAAVGNINIACQKMEKLKEAGFKFAIDDFGSGFSSFVYLKNMPVDIVKIEGEFVERLTSDEVDRAMVKSMIDIAKACGKEVVAEFVCDGETLEILQDYGVDYVQGYFIAEPKPELVHTTLDSLLLENLSVLKSQPSKSA